MRKLYLVLALMLCLAVLTGCQSGEGRYYDNSTSAPTQNNNPLETPQTPKAPAQPAQPEFNIDYDSGLYDPASEEGKGLEDPALNLTYVTPALTMRSEFAGATPVPIDPIDMPTPTMVPPLSFVYQTYTASQLGLTFDAPMGWIKDESVANTFTLYNPDPTMDYAATLTLMAVNVGSNYNESQLKSEVQSMLNSIDAMLNDFEPSNTATRTLIGYNGVYANYTGTIEGGTKVAGRVHATSFNNKLYTLHITYPRAYTETYKEGVYDKVRDTIKAQ